VRPAAIARVLAVTRALSDQIKVRITSNPGETLPIGNDRAGREGAERQKTLK